MEELIADAIITVFKLVILGCIIVFAAALATFALEEMGAWRRIQRFIREFRMHSRHSRTWAIALVLIVSIIWGTGLASELLAPPKPAKAPEREKTVYDTLYYCASQSASTRDSPLCTNVTELVRQLQLNAQQASVAK